MEENPEERLFSTENSHFLLACMSRKHVPHIFLYAFLWKCLWQPAAGVMEEVEAEGEEVVMTI
jgi:hypothetical protein